MTDGIRHFPIRKPFARPSAGARSLRARAISPQPRSRASTVIDSRPFEWNCFQSVLRNDVRWRCERRVCLPVLPACKARAAKRAGPSRWVGIFGGVLTAPPERNSSAVRSRQLSQLCGSVAVPHRPSLHALSLYRMLSHIVLSPTRIMVVVNTYNIMWVTVDRISSSRNPIAEEKQDGKDIHVPGGAVGKTYEVELFKPSLGFVVGLKLMSAS
jgi:hypothetical protein